MVPAEKSVWSSQWIIEKLINRPCGSFWIWNKLWRCWSSRIFRWCQFWRSYRQKKKPDPDAWYFAYQHLYWKWTDLYRAHGIINHCSKMGTLENHTNLSFIIIFWRLVPQNLRNLLLELALLMDEICYTACPGYYPGHIATFSVNTSKYTLTKYSYCVRIIIVFDKYEDECSTKCQEYPAGL